MGEKQDTFIAILAPAVMVEAMQSGHSAGWVSGTMIEAMFIPDEALPNDLIKLGRMVLEFVDSLVREEPYPEWYKDEWVRDEW